MRGATPIVGVILLLLITIAAGGSTYLWLTRTQSKIFTQASTGIEESAKDVYGKISIISVWNESTMLCILIRNTSDQDITYTSDDLKKMAVLIDGEPYDFNQSAMVDLDQGEVLTFCVCNTTSSDCGGGIGPYIYTYSGKSINIKVDPPFGTGDECDYSYPEGC